MKLDNLNENITEEKKKRIPWNKGLHFHFTEEEKELKYASRRGLTPWNKGIPVSEETKKKISENRKGKALSKETYEKIGKKLKGHIVSEETRKKISETQKGRPSPIKGKKFTEEHKRKISEALKGNKNGLGKICSDEKKKKISKAIKGRKVSQETIEKTLETRRKNGTLNTYSPEAKRKEIETKRKNGTLNSSRVEKIIEKKLKLKYNDLKTQYTSKSYPFHCDFYIPKLNLYIEYQGHWSHGKISNKKILGAFNESNPEHIKVLNKWKEKAKISEYYLNAITVWTEKDPLKRKIAKENNLNYLEFWNLNEFNKWYNAL